MSTREERLGYARALIRSHPNWGKDRINLAVKNEYGMGIRRVDMAHLKMEMVFDEGKFAPPDAPPADQRIISMGFIEAQQLLVSSGFLPKEIRELFSGHGVVDMLNSKPLHAMLRERRRWVADMRHKGMTGKQIIAAIQAWYAQGEGDGGKKRSPFDFLRREYRPPVKIERKEYREAARRRAQSMIQSLYRRNRR